MPKVFSVKLPRPDKKPLYEHWVLESDSSVRRTTYDDGDVQRVIVRTYDYLSDDLASSHGEVSSRWSRLG